MIKFFRHIRMNLMETGKTGKYFKYAIGEIVLVVIGILIALSINNWNENKKANIKFNKLLVNVFNNLKVDLEEVQGVIDFYNKKDTLGTNIINGKYSVSDYKNNVIPDILFFGYTGFYVTDIGYNALMENTDNIPSEYEQLIADLNRQFIITAERIEANLKVFSNIVESTRTRYALNFPWYSQTDSVSNEKRRQYSVNNPIYKNEVRLYKRYGIENFSRSVKHFYQQGLPLFLTLKKAINDTSPLPSFFPKNADSFDSVKSDYLGNYLFSNGNELIVKEINGFLFIYINDSPSAILSFVSKDILKNHNNGRILTFKRDKSNKVIGWTNGSNTITKVTAND